MIERLCRSEDTRRARLSIDKCADSVFCGTSSRRARSPAARPSGSCLTSVRNASRRVGWDSAASARTAFSISIYLELRNYGRRVNRRSGPAIHALYRFAADRLRTLRGATSLANPGKTAKEPASSSAATVAEESGRMPAVRAPASSSAAARRPGSASSQARPRDHRKSRSGCRRYQACWR